MSWWSPNILVSESDQAGKPFEEYLVVLKRVILDTTTLAKWWTLRQLFLSNAGFREPFPIETRLEIIERLMETAGIRFSRKSCRGVAKLRTHPESRNCLHTFHKKWTERSMLTLMRPGEIQKNIRFHKRFRWNWRPWDDFYDRTVHQLTHLWLSGGYRPSFTWKVKRKTQNQFSGVHLTRRSVERSKCCVRALRYPVTGL